MIPGGDTVPAAGDVPAGDPVPRRTLNPAACSARTASLTERLLTSGTARAPTAIRAEARDAGRSRIYDLVPSVASRGRRLSLGSYEAASMCSVGSRDTSLSVLPAAVFS